MEEFILKEDLRLLCVTASSFPEGILPAFRQLETILGNKTADKSFFGISKPHNNKIIYKACVLENSISQPLKPDLEIVVLLKGKYMSKLITNWKNNNSLIGDAFEELIANPRLDPKSYCIEWYKNEHDVLCMVRISEDSE